MMRLSSSQIIGLSGFQMGFKKLHPLTTKQVWAISTVLSDMSNPDLNNTYIHAFTVRILMQQGLKNTEHSNSEPIQNMNVARAMY